MATPRSCIIAVHDSGWLPEQKQSLRLDGLWHLPYKQEEPEFESQRDCDMIGQLSDSNFKELFPNALIDNSTRTTITYFGRDTINYWRQEEDGSWTNYDCKTKPGRSLR